MVSLEEARAQIEDLKIQVEGINMGYHDLREIEVSIIRIGSALEKMTGSKEVERAISDLNRLIWTIRSVQIAIHALELAEGPIGWIYFAATLVGTGAMMYDTIRGF